MSYCVNCGVELDKTDDRCPLCGTEVMNPAQPVDTVSPRPYARARLVLKRADFAFIVIVYSAILLAINIICFITNAVFTPQTTWWLIVFTTTILLAAAVDLPLLSKKLPLYRYAGTLAAATLLLLFSIAYVINSYLWFLKLAAPILALLTLLVLAWIRVVRTAGLGILSMASLSFAMLGVLLLAIEAFIGFFLNASITFTWSLVSFACCVSIVIVLHAITRNAKWRTEIRKRFHM